MSDKNWDVIRNFYIDKKFNWAKSTSCYGDRKTPWGNEKPSSDESYPDGVYGFGLLPPYGEVEVVTYEQEMGFMLPEDLRNYLLLVSREMFFRSYPIVFSLNTRHKSRLGTCNIPSHKRMWTMEDAHSIEDEDGVDDDVEWWTAGMVQISERGCSFQDYIVLCGNDVGRIWESDGDETLFPFKGSFFDYISKDIVKTHTSLCPMSLLHFSGGNFNIQ